MDGIHNHIERHSVNKKHNDIYGNISKTVDTMAIQVYHRVICWRGSVQDPVYCSNKPDVRFLQNHYRKGC